MQGNCLGGLSTIYRARVDRLDIPSLTNTHRMGSIGLKVSCRSMPYSEGRSS